MCRMILSVGRFDERAVLQAAVLMSEGVTSCKPGPTPVHRDGWGAVYRTRGYRDLSSHRSIRPINESFGELDLPWDGVDVLAVHARHATLAATRGLPFTHPVTREGSPWLLFHNGFLPTLYRELGLLRSDFDTQEYFDYILRASDLRLVEEEVLALLQTLAPGGTSANAFFINPERAYALNWFPADSPYPDFYTMWSLCLSGAAYIASEPVEMLAPTDRWRPLPMGRLIEIPLPPPDASSSEFPEFLPPRFSRGVNHG
jgi:predicted glutamine amidotransferase